MSSRGERSRRSVSAAAGWTRAAAKARTVARSWRCVSVSSTRTLASLPGGRPLLEERLQALDPVLGREGDAEGLDLEAAARLQVDVRRDRRRALRLRERDRRPGGELGGELRRLLGEPLAGHDAAHEPHAQRLLGGDPVPQVDELARPRLPDAPHQALRPAEARDEPEADLGPAEPRLLQSDQQN